MQINEHEVVASLCKGSFRDFVKEFWEVISEEELQWNWHMDVLCGELGEIAFAVGRREKRKHDLVINVPPGSSKSSICSQLFPAWVWTWFPSAQFLCMSYAHPLALRDALKTRDILDSEKYQKCFPGIKLREDANTKGLFVNTRKGYRLSAGVMGTVTGFHGHFLMVDDPLNPEQSYSEAELKRINRWMRSTLPSRRIPKDVAPIILIGQRLAQADPSGDMLERAKGRVRHICLPGELTDDVQPPELKSKYIDGFLDPVRLGRKALDDMREDLGAYGYASQVLQTPVPLGGGMFEVDKINRMDNPPKAFREVIRSWDKAASENTGKYTRGIKMAKDTDGHYWILDVTGGQWGSTKRERRMRETAEADGINVPIIIEIEGGSGGKESGEGSVRNLEGFRVETFHPTGDKPARAYAFSSQVGAGNVYVLNRHWTNAYIDELRYFPYGKYSDQVDASSAGFNWLARRKVKIGALW